MPKSLFDRVNEAKKKGRIINVSGLLDNGKGARIQDKPGGDHSIKVIGELAIGSDNYLAYKKAIHMLGPQYSHFADEYYKRYVDTNEILSPRSPSSRNKSNRKSSPRYQHTSLDRSSSNLKSPQRSSPSRRRSNQKPFLQSSPRKCGICQKSSSRSYSFQQLSSPRR